MHAAAVATMTEIAASARISRRTTFLDLPREVRDHIYTLLLKSEEPIRLDGTRETTLNVEILRLCRQVYSESVKVLYRQNHFNFLIYDQRGLPFYPDLSARGTMTKRNFVQIRYMTLTVSLGEAPRYTLVAFPEVPKTYRVEQPYAKKVKVRVGDLVCVSGSLDEPMILCGKLDHSEEGFAAQSEPKPRRRKCRLPRECLSTGPVEPCPSSFHTDIAQPAHYPILSDMELRRPLEIEERLLADSEDYRYLLSRVVPFDWRSRRQYFYNPYLQALWERQKSPTLTFKDFRYTDHFIETRKAWMRSNYYMEINGNFYPPQQYICMKGIAEDLKDVEDLRELHIVVKGAKVGWIRSLKGTLRPLKSKLDIPKVTVQGCSDKLAKELVDILQSRPVPIIKVPKARKPESIASDIFDSVSYIQEDSVLGLFGWNSDASTNVEF